MTITHDTAVPHYCSLYERSGKSPEDFARYMLARNHDLCLMVVEVIGSWPSSEPELAALQRLYH